MCTSKSHGLLGQGTALWLLRGKRPSRKVRSIWDQRSQWHDSKWPRPPGGITSQLKARLIPGNQTLLLFAFLLFSTDLTPLRYLPALPPRGLPSRRLWCGVCSVCRRPHSAPPFTPAPVPGSAQRSTWGPLLPIASSWLQSATARQDEPGRDDTGQDSCLSLGITKGKPKHFSFFFLISKIKKI